MADPMELPEQGGLSNREPTQDQDQGQHQQPRDDGGRFAEGERRPEGADQGRQEPQSQGDGDQGQRQEMVPHQALHAAREETKALKERYGALETRDRERDAVVLDLQRQNLQMMQMLRGQMPQGQGQGQPQQPPAPPPDWFVDPDAATKHAFQQNFSPFQEAYQQDRNAAFQNHLAMSKEIAAVRYGDDVVQQAENWLDQTLKTNPAMKPILQELVLAPGKLPGVEMVKLYRGETPLGRPQSIDPLVEAEVNRRLAAMGHAAPPQGGMPGIPAAPPQAVPAAPGQRPAPPQMPTSFATAPNGGPRSSPQASGPRSLSEIMGGR